MGTEAEVVSSRFQELLRSLWECHVEDLCKVSGSEPDLLLRIPPITCKTKLLWTPRGASPEYLSERPPLPNNRSTAPGDDHDFSVTLAGTADPHAHEEHAAQDDDAYLEKLEKYDADSEKSEANVHKELSCMEQEPVDASLAITASENLGVDVSLRRWWHDMASSSRKDMTDNKESSTSRKVHTSVRSNFRVEAEFDSCEDLTSPGFMKRWIAPPGTGKRLSWDMLGGLLILYDMVKIPMTAFDTADSLFSTVLDWVTLIFWTLDIPACFFVGYVSQGRIIMDAKSIARRYLTGLFFIDASVILLDWIFTFILSTQSLHGDGSKLLRSLRIARILRLVRVMKLRWLQDAILDYVDSEALDACMKILQWLFTLLCINHWIACVWYGIAGSGPADSGRTKWTQQLHDASFGYTYTTSFHWAVTQFTPASMEVHPTNTDERCFSIFAIILGLVFFAYIVGNITVSLSSLRELSTASTRQIFVLRRYMKQNGMPKELTKRVLRFAEHAQRVDQQKLPMTQVTILRHLSPQLLAEVKCSMNLPHLQIHPLFEHFNENASVTLNKVAEAVTRTLHASSDTIFLPSQTGTALYFLSQGRLLYTRILSSGEIRAELLHAGRGWIAEPVLWCAEWLHVGEAKAHTDLEVLMLDANEFEDMLRLVRPLSRTCADYAQAFLKWLQTSELTDVIQSDRESDRICSFIPVE